VRYQRAGSNRNGILLLIAVIVAVAAVAAWFLLIAPR